MVNSLVWLTVDVMFSSHKRCYNNFAIFMYIIKYMCVCEKYLNRNNEVCYFLSTIFSLSAALSKTCIKILKLGDESPSPKPMFNNRKGIML